MKILDAKVKWNFEWANDPTLQVYVDEIPHGNEIPHMRVNKENSIAYWGEKDGYVDFFVSTNDKSGYGGRTFHTLLEDGTYDDVKGPWSSGSYAMNRYFPHSVDVSITDKSDVLEKGFTFYGGHITLQKAIEACAFASKNEGGLILLKKVWFSSYYNYVPVLYDNPCNHEIRGGNNRCSKCNHKVYYHPVDENGHEYDFLVPLQDKERFEKSLEEVNG